MGPGAPDAFDPERLPGDGFWLMTSPFPNHLFHLIEGCTGPFNMWRRRDRYPPIRMLMGGNISPADRPNVWQTFQFLTGPLLEHTKGVNPPPLPKAYGWGVRTRRHPLVAKVRDAFLPGKAKRICFERMYLAGRAMSPLMGGHLAAFDDAAAFFDAAVTHFQPKLLPPPKRALRAFVVRRKKGFNGRTWRNENAIFKVMNRLGINYR